jgi:hypothetical protein
LTIYPVERIEEAMQVVRGWTEHRSGKAQSAPMNFSKILAPLAIVVFTIGAWQAFQWAGIALAVGGVVMWICCISRAWSPS